MTAAHQDDYQIGQRVQVFHDWSRGGERAPWYVGTVVEYWRNGCFIIREDEHGTTCAYSVKDLAAA